MATDGTPTVSVSQQTIDGRLDTIDRALLGVMPRTERLEMVSKIEARIRDLLTAGDAGVATALQEPLASAPESLSAARPTRKRSRLALSAGICGLVSIALMFTIPIVYIFVSYFASGLGDTLVLISIGVVHLATFAAGAAAVVLGIAGLVKIARRSGRLFGSGWAITGICAGPLPVLAAGVPLLLAGLSTVLASGNAMSVGPSFPVSTGPSCSTCGPAPGYTSAPAAPLPSTAGYQQGPVVPSSPYPTYGPYPSTPAVAPTPSYPLAADPSISTTPALPPAPNLAPPPLPSGPTETPASAPEPGTKAGSEAKRVAEEESAVPDVPATEIAE